MVDTRPRPSSRVERRKAQTRGKLLGAARALLAENSAATASVQEITNRADVGFGSFYNHFTTKSELFEAAVHGVVQELGNTLDALSRPLDDPARAFSQSVRITGRLAAAPTETSRILVRHGIDHLESGLGPRAARDVAAGVDSGRFLVGDVALAVAVTGGSLLGMLHLVRNDLDRDSAQCCDAVAEALLRMLGVDAAEARLISREELPTIRWTEQAE